MALQIMIHLGLWMKMENPLIYFDLHIIIIIITLYFFGV